MKFLEQLFCHSGIRNLSILARWYPEGPSFSFFPYPVADTSKPWGDPTCNKCSGTCYGHYVTDVKELLKLHATGKAIRCLPPSQIISEFHKTLDGRNAEKSEVNELSKKCLLSPDDFQLWLEHLEQVSINRKKGAEKASVTRKNKKKQKMKKSLFSYETFTVHVIRLYHAVAVTRVQLCFQYSQRL